MGYARLIARYSLLRRSQKIFQISSPAATPCLRRAILRLFWSITARAMTRRGILQHLRKGRSVCAACGFEINQGYGFGILAGLRAARGDILGWTHADLADRCGDALRGLAVFKQNPARKCSSKAVANGRNFGDVAFTFACRALRPALFGAPFWDVNAQPAMFSARLVRHVEKSAA